MATTYSIAPGVIATPGSTGGPAFHLSTDQWTAVQVYVNDALALPITEVEFRNHLGNGAPASLSDFTQLITLYGQMNAACVTWKQTTFPATISLAGDVYEYGSTKASIYYNAILAEANALIANPDDQHAAQALAAILKVLQGYANASQVKAQAAMTQINALITEMQDAQIQLIGPDGVSGLKKYYNDRYGAASTQQQNLNDAIAAARLALAADQAQYTHDCLVAETTPTYGWVWPFGTIAAAIVAGIYGHKAVEDLDNIHDDNDQIQRLTDDIAALANMINALNLAISGIGGIVPALQAALPVVEAIEGAWGSIADRIGAIATLITTQISDVPPIIMDLGVIDAIGEWEDVAKLADAYRLNAYIDVSATPLAPAAGTTPARAAASMVSMEQWRVGSLTASPGARLAAAA